MNSQGPCTSEALATIQCQALGKTMAPAPGNQEKEGAEFLIRRGNLNWPRALGREGEEHKFLLPHTSPEGRVIQQWLCCWVLGNDHKHGDQGNKVICCCTLPPPALNYCKGTTSLPGPRNVLSGMYNLGYSSDAFKHNIWFYADRLSGCLISKTQTFGFHHHPSCAMNTGISHGLVHERKFSALVQTFEAETLEKQPINLSWTLRGL